MITTAASPSIAVLEASLVPGLIAVGSAVSFAMSNALQHRAAGTVPSTVKGALPVLGHLSRQPAWLLATCVSFVAVLLHAVALGLGSIALVQPLMLLGVVLAVPLRALLGRTAPSWCEIRAVVVTGAGLAVFVVTANPRPSGREADPVAWLLFVVGCFILGTGVLHASRSQSSSARQAALLGVGAGVMFGATAGLLKLFGAALTADTRNPLELVALLGALVAAGLMGTAMNQRAYQIARISYSLPVVNVVDIVVALLFGAMVLGELPAQSLTVIGVQVAALGCVVAGLRLISMLPHELDSFAPRQESPAYVTAGVAS